MPEVPSAACHWPPGGVLYNASINQTYGTRYLIDENPDCHGKFNIVLGRISGGERSNIHSPRTYMISTNDDATMQSSDVMLRTCIRGGQDCGLRTTIPHSAPPALLPGSVVHRTFLKIQPALPQYCCMPIVDRTLPLFLIVHFVISSASSRHEQQ